MSSSPVQQRTAWAATAAALSAVAGWLAFAPMRHAFFRHDDFGWLRVAQHWASAKSVWPALSMGHAGFTVLYNFIYYACYLAGGLDPRVYWDVLLAAHAAACALVSWLAYVLTDSPVAAAGAGVLFALLFTHHEAVGWLGGGLHVFALVFMLASLLAWIAWRRRGRGWHLAGALLFATAALLTKASAISLVLLVALWEGQLSPRRNFRTLWWWAIPYGVMVAMRIAYPPAHYVVAPGSCVYWPGPHMVANLMLCVPQMLVPDLGLPNYAALVRAHFPPAAASAIIFASNIAIAALFGFSVGLLIRGDALTRFAIAWCYIAFLPFAPFRCDYAIAPRYLYIPSVGLALLAGHWLAGLTARLDRRRAAAAMALFVFAVAAYNIPPLLVMQRHRLRDSAVRRTAITEGLIALRRLPTGARVLITGLPKPFADLAQALRVFSHDRAAVRWAPSPKRRRAGEYVLVFAPDGRLQELLHPPGPKTPPWPAPPVILPRGAAPER